MNNNFLTEWTIWVWSIVIGAIAFTVMVSTRSVIDGWTIGVSVVIFIFSFGLFFFFLWKKKEKELLPWVGRPIQNVRTPSGYERKRKKKVPYLKDIGLGRKRLYAPDYQKFIEAERKYREKKLEENG